MELIVTLDPPGTVTISSKEQAGEQPAVNPTRQGTITSITYGGQITEIGLNGFSHGSLNISDATDIVSADNRKLTFADLRLGLSIEAEHSPVMAMSMPPMPSAKKVIVKEQPASEQILGSLGTVEEITAAADGTAQRASSSRPPS